MSSSFFRSTSIKNKYDEIITNDCWILRNLQYPSTENDEGLYLSSAGRGNLPLNDYQSSVQLILVINVFSRLSCTCSSWFCICRRRIKMSPLKLKWANDREGVRETGRRKNNFFEAYTRDFRLKSIKRLDSFWRGRKIRKSDSIDDKSF